MKLTPVMGARRQIIKSAPIIHKAFEKSGIDLQLIDFGQCCGFERAYTRSSLDTLKRR